MVKKKRKKERKSACQEETPVLSLGQDDPLEKSITTDSSILTRGNPMDRGDRQVTVHGVP